jgi:SAM-dependent methyltransferase
LIPFTLSSPPTFHFQPGRSNRKPWLFPSSIFYSPSSPALACFYLFSILYSMNTMPPDPAQIDHVEDPKPFSIEDEKFDLIYSPRLRELSSMFWTPVAVAAEAAEMLVTAPATRVLDIGCGAGKFCLVGASLTDGRFTGVEQRSELVSAARQAAAGLHLPDVEFLHGNVMGVAFADYNAFYLFNPFEEHLFNRPRIDNAVARSPELFKRYTKHVAAQLGARPFGTRVVTYLGYADDIPACYDCESTFFDDDLKLWIKNREFDPDIEGLSLRVSRSYRGRKGWQAPRKV